jgi:hypothetical protein
VSIVLKAAGDEAAAPQEAGELGDCMMVGAALPPDDSGREAVIDACETLERAIAEICAEDRDYWGRVLILEI